MEQFRIIESRPATYFWEYIIEANDENEALQIVFDGEVEANEAWCEESESDDSEFSVYPADNNTNE